MVRVFVVLVALVVVCEIFALVDAAFADRSRVRGVPKPAWIVIVLFVPLFGSLLWFFVGRPRRGDAAGQRPRRQQRSRTIAPDDDPEFLDRLRRELDKDDDVER